MANVIETAKAAVIAYVRTMKRTGIRHGSRLSKRRRTSRRPRDGRLEGVKQIIEAWQRWANAFPDSKASFVSEYASGNVAVLERVCRVVQTGPLQTPTRYFSTTCRAALRRVCGSRRSGSSSGR
jgi:hypothetical protein